ncbi:MAG: hypothetical protein WBD87_08775 [Candidatus Acidiferrales bacterium]
MGKVVQIERVRPGAISIEPDLKEFIDECLVSMLVRDALKDLAAKDKEPLARVCPVVAHFAASALCSAEEMA